MPFSLDDFSADELRRIRDKIDSVRGPGVTNAPRSITINPQTNAQANAPSQTKVVVVKVNANASGGGKYTGVILTAPAAAVPLTGNLATTEIGTTPTDADDTLILNMDEVSQSTHDLTAGTPKVTLFIGLLIPGAASDGKRLVVINGIDWEACS